MTRFSKQQLMIRFTSFALITCLLVPMIGCGPSKEEMMLRAASRSRPKDAGERKGGDKKEESPPAKAVAAKKDQPKRPAVTATPVSAEKKPTISEVMDSPEPENDSLVDLKTIEERKPATPLSIQERRKRAYENLTKILAALKKYQDDHRGYWPPRYVTSASRIETLSWRVELLPYLGYEELYSKFDSSVPWDMEPNASLLKYIPDEYVSPERFDTKTNFLLPAYRKFLFGEDDRKMLASDIEDGAENTILLAEFSDHLAVEWTSPNDYEPKNLKTLSKDLAGARGDGAYAAWANGWPFLLAKSVTTQQAMQALTASSGDALRAGDIHLKIAIDDTSAVEEPSEDLAATEIAPVEMETVEPVVEVATKATLKRESAPSDALIKTASDRLRTIYGTKIRAARTDDEKRKLASEMLELAKDMENDLAGAYAIHNAALSFAVKIADAGLLVDVIDQRVARFEVDAYQVNLDWINHFIDETAKFNEDAIDGSDELLSRLISVIHAAVLEDDYAQAARLTRLASRLTDRDGHERVPKLLNRLRAVLGSAKIEYDKSAEKLATYRKDPDNVIAGAAVGHFLCFFKGDWQQGLPLIAAGDEHADLRSVAATDIAGATDISTQVAIGDAWWELSRRGRGAYRQGSQDRAVYWYLQAFENIPVSLERMHVKNRLSEADDADGSSPLVLCNQLAEELGVDLDGGLLAIAEMKRQGKRVRRGGVAQRDEDYDEG